MSLTGGIRRTNPLRWLYRLRQPDRFVFGALMIELGRISP
jgi:hypothetical protein